MQTLWSDVISNKKVMYEQKESLISDVVYYFSPNYTTEQEINTCLQKKQKKQKKNKEKWMLFLLYSLTIRGPQSDRRSVYSWDTFLIFKT